MNNKKLKPITYSNEWFTRKSHYVIAGILFLIALACLTFLVFAIVSDGLWWLFIIVLPVAGFFIFLAYIVYPIKQKHLYSYKLSSTELSQEWENTKTNEKVNKFIPLKEIDHILIGMLVKHIPIRNNREFYRYYASLIIMHEDDYFIEKFLSEDDLQEWIRRLEGNAPIYYTNNDLSEAQRALYDTKIDFSQVDSVRNDIVSHLVGKESYQNNLISWMPEGMSKTIKTKEDKKIQPRTKKAEKNTFWIIFIYNFLFALFIFPRTPLDEDLFIEITEEIVFGFLMINLFIPTILVFFRKFTKWYLPLLYTGASLLAQSLVVIGLVLVTDLPFIYGSLLILHLFLLVIWSCALIIAKVIKFVSD